MNPKAVLISSNQEPRILNAKEELNLTKKIEKSKLNGITTKNEENIFSHTHKEFEKFRAENAALEVKLKYVEELVKNSSDKDDGFIIKSIKDYLGIIMQPKTFETSQLVDKKNTLHDESFVDGKFVIGPPKGNEIIIFVKSESI